MSLKEDDMLQLATWDLRSAEIVQSYWSLIKLGVRELT
jgi:hypothetical protein